MPAATDKTELLAAFDIEFDRLMRLIAPLGEAEAGLSAPDDETSVKAVIAHRTHWIGLFIGWAEDGRAGRTVEVPAPGVKWNELKPYNAKLYAAAEARPWSEVAGAFKTEAARLRDFIDAADNDELYTVGHYDWLGAKWTMGRYAEASGPSHFRSAAAYIRKTLRAAGLR